MTRTVHLLLALALLAAGLILALGFPDTEFGWFRGQPLGIVLAVVGGFDLVAALTRRA